MAAEMLVEIQKITAVEISATTLFLEPTIAELAKSIKAFRAEGSASPCDSPL
jgi:hypothetical protein